MAQAQLDARKEFDQIVADAHKKAGQIVEYFQERGCPSERKSNE